MIRLFINWYEETKQPRGSELNTCIENNFRLPHIDEIVNISDCHLPEGKIVNLDFAFRPTYSNYFKIISEVVEPEDISIIANLDIYFDETILLAKDMQSNECYALSRWETNFDGSKGKQVQDRGDSQDAWIFKGKVKPVPNSDFLLGKLGCDNRIAYELMKAGYEVSNPSKSIRTWHVHQSGYRPNSQNVKEKIPPPYHRIKPTAI